MVGRGPGSCRPTDTGVVRSQPGRVERMRALNPDAGGRVAAQEYTADPKTDAKLGRVGI